MVDYKIQVYNGNEAFGTTGRTIAIQEQPRTISQDFMAEELHHVNELIPKATVKEVLGNFAKVAARLMAEGFAIQFQNDGDVVLRLYADAKIKGGNINLQRAKELNPDITEITQDNASDLVQRAGIQLRAYAEVQTKFNELLQEFKPSAHMLGVEEKAYVEKKNDEQSGGQNVGGNSGGNTGGNNSEGNNGSGGFETGS